MNDLMKSTITSMEVAEMVEKRHADLLKDIRKYVRQLNEGNISPVDFFTESVRIDIKGQQQPCYLVTKKGCEFIAHKMTGQKGTEFTARYINRFHEMEHQARQIPITEHPGEVARLINSLATIMKNNQSAPKEIAENTKLVCEQYGIRLIDGFVKIPEYEQLELPINFRGGGSTV
mgnify:CR=1 FL=1